MLFSIYIPLYENFIKTAHGLFELLSNLHLNSPAIRLALYFSEAVRSGFYRPIYEALRRYFTSEGYGTHKACFGQQFSITWRPPPGFPGLIIETFARRS